MRKRQRPRLPNSVYLAFFTGAAKLVRAAGFTTLPGGGIFGRHEMDRMDEYCEQGQAPEVFAQWVITRRIEQQQADLALEGLNIGNETIALGEVA